MSVSFECCEQLMFVEQSLEVIVSRLTQERHGSIGAVDLEPSMARHLAIIAKTPHQPSGRIVEREPGSEGKCAMPADAAR